MVHRKAIGATLAATLLFSSLLLSNLALLSAGDLRLRLSMTADSESLLADTATVVAGSEGAQVLSSIQGFISAGPLQCQTAIAMVAQYIGSLSAAISQEGLNVTARATVGGGSPQADNLTMLRPFNGSISGDVNVDLRLDWSGLSPLGDVTYNKTEIHNLHLPARLGQIVGFCQSSMMEIVYRLQSQPLPSCNSSSVWQALSTVEEDLRTRATALALNISLGYGVVRSPSCVVELNLQVLQQGVMGPEGPFTVQLGREASVGVRVGG